MMTKVLGLRCCEATMHTDRYHRLAVASLLSIIIACVYYKQVVTFRLRYVFRIFIDVSQKLHIERLFLAY